MSFAMSAFSIRQRSPDEELIAQIRKAVAIEAANPATGEVVQLRTAPEYSDEFRVETLRIMFHDAEGLQHLRGLVECNPMRVI